MRKATCKKYSRVEEQARKEQSLPDNNKQAKAMDPQAPNCVRIGGASGYWGDSDLAVPQLLADESLDFIVFDYLAEITMSLLARAKAKDPSAGYATDFVTSALAPNLDKIATQGVKIVSNAGGLNPEGCAEAVRALCAKAGLDLKVATVTGDDLSGRASDFAAQGISEMFSGAAFPDANKLASINAYIGGLEIAEALNAGADIVITGRCVDSAVTLGACAHAFGWGANDLDCLAGASLAGHIIECGTQATGGNHTDWEIVKDSLVDIGYPIAEVFADGHCEISKPQGTGGAVTPFTVGEQMLYEIGDPQAYVLPDVVCDFSGVSLIQKTKDVVSVSGAKGAKPTDTYKVCATYTDGWRAGIVFFFYGEQAVDKANVFAELALQRSRTKLKTLGAPDYDETMIEIIGNESHYGEHNKVTGSREVALKIAVKHADPRAAGLLLKEATGAALSAPPGLSIFAGGRPKPSPVVRLFSFLMPKSAVRLSATINGDAIALDGSSAETTSRLVIDRVVPPASVNEDLADTEVPLIELAVARSGDKGDKANIGVMARREEYLPWIWAALTEEEVAARFGHFLKGPVERFYLPGTHSINFLLHDVLAGGGIASLRNDPQAKGYSQILLQTPIRIPRELKELC